MAKRVKARGLTILAGATLVGPESSSKGDIAIEGDKIQSVGRVSHAKGDRVVDAAGLYITPGLIDCHTHFVLDGDPDPLIITGRTDTQLAIKGVGLAADTLRGGVTSVRDNGSRNFINLALRDAINAGWCAGPRVVAAGEWLTMTGGHGHFMGHEIDGIDEARKAARLQMKRGGDAIKVMATGGVMTPGVNHRATQLVVEEIRVIAEEAARAERKVAAHAHGAGGIKNAVDAGCASVEHGTFMDEEGARKMAKAGVFWVPTMMALDCMRTKGAAHGLPEFAVKKAREAEEAITATWKLALKHGVRVAMGTDAGTPFNYHGENARELELYVRYGMTARQALAASTRNAAELLGWKGKVGELRAGAFADLIVLSSDPSKDVRAFQNARRAVIKGGALCHGSLKGFA